MRTYVRLPEEIASQIQTSNHLGRQQRDRVNGGDLEPGDELRGGLAGLRALLRGDVRRALARHPPSSYEQGFALKLWPQRLEQPLKWSDSGRIQHDDTKRVVQAGAIARPRIPSQAPRSFGRWQRAPRSERHLSGGSQSSMRRLAAGGRPGISSLARRCRSGCALSCW